VTARVANWPTVLHEQVEAARLRPFVWGSWDCCQFVGEVVVALTGRDQRELFPTYSTEDEADAILAAHAGMHGLLERAFGPPIPVAFAKRGDIALVDLALGLQPGICLGSVCAAPGLKGLQFVPMSMALAAWRV